MTQISLEAEREYKSLLKDLGALSRLFSESDKPFIQSRTAEYLYCKIFNAENLSRSDITIDAKYLDTGVGVKTFIYSGKPSYQKIAEFNRAITSHRNLHGLEKARFVSDLRNERIRFVSTTYGVNKFIYHCILRDDNKIIVYEEEMAKINIENIIIKSVNDSTILFTDGRNNYKFSISKSTLLKEFKPLKPILETGVKILNDPFSLLSKLSMPIAESTSYIPRERIVLPMYGYEQGKQHVFPKSGLNQWNAGGRPRNYDEVYLPIPAEIRNNYPDFLPDREKPFDLHLPNGSVLNSKVSQDNGKALMSNPNSALGEWLLRDVLGLKEGELLTYNKLLEIGVDSVEIFKKDGDYYVNFLHKGSYEKFIDP
jgi:hypothetical protein